MAMGNHSTVFPRQIIAVHEINVIENSLREVRSLRTDSLLGKERHVRQVSLDHHPATVHNRHKTIIGTLNVMTLYECGNLENAKLKIQRLNINILGVCETRQISNDDFVSDGHMIIYVGEKQNERRVGLLLDKEICSGTLSPVGQSSCETESEHFQYNQQ